MKEIWKPIKEYEGWYSISNYGRVRRDMRGSGAQVGRIRKEGLDLDGYSKVMLSKNNVNRHFKVHKLVANAFIGECPDGMEINHIDTIRNNNYYKNLEYKSHKENVLHSYKMGRSRRTGKRKLNDMTVLCIRRAYALGGYTNKDLGKFYNVDPSTISRIVTFDSWKKSDDSDSQQSDSSKVAQED